MPTPQSLIKKCERLEHAEKLQESLDALKRPLSRADQKHYLSQIMSLAAQGKITAAEARKLTKAVSGTR